MCCKQSMPTKTFLFRHTCSFIICERFLNNGWNVNEISLVDTSNGNGCRTCTSRRKLISAFKRYRRKGSCNFIAFLESAQRFQIISFTLYV